MNFNEWVIRTKEKAESEVTTLKTKVKDHSEKVVDAFNEWIGTKQGKLFIKLMSLVAKATVTVMVNRFWNMVFELLSKIKIH
ncbi:hypothetical protein [Butyrivibrio sp. JL13D10]|uniref:hypothetical protein n=1 Tax=Butyrivibrio sp. JL13D10 TaxID=3236815 RepID=UPI0038B68D16